MILLLRHDDGALVLFESLQDVTRHLEAIDIENGEYEFCDSSGQRFLGVVTRAVGTFRPGAFELRPEGPPDPANAIALLDRAVRLEENPWHRDVESLRRHLTCA